MGGGCCSNMSEKARPYFIYRDYPVLIETLITQKQAVYQKDMRLFFCPQRKGNF